MPDRRCGFCTRPIDEPKQWGEQEVDICGGCFTEWKKIVGRKP